MSDKIWDDAVAEGKAKMIESMERALRRRIEVESSGAKIHGIETKYALALSQAISIAEKIWEKHFKKESPGWKPFDDLAGVLNQIENMTIGLERKLPGDWS